MPLGPCSTPGRPTAQQDLVDIVVQDEAEVIDVVSTKPDGDLLGYGVAESVRVAEPFAFHDLDRLRSGRLGSQRPNDQLHVSPE